MNKKIPTSIIIDDESMKCAGNVRSICFMFVKSIMFFISSIKKHHAPDYMTILVHLQHEINREMKTLSKEENDIILDAKNKFHV